MTSSQRLDAIMPARAGNGRTQSSAEAGLKYLDTAGAAAYLGLSRRTLEGMRVRGDGPVFHKLGPRKGAKVAYRSTDLDAWLGNFRFSRTSDYADR
jgi:hypothetical protein